MMAPPASTALPATLAPHGSPTKAMADQTAPSSPEHSSRARALSRYGPGYAALIGLVALAILLQAIFAGVFIEPGGHPGSLNAHDINADVALGVSVIAAVYALVLLRKPAPSLAIGAVVLVVLLVALVAIGHAITGSGDHGLTPVHIPLALLAFGLTIWLSVRARTLRKSSV
jgi:hypothetical protein